jgi:RNA polymerase sigma-70 factor (ECF subfamily)
VDRILCEKLYDTYYMRIYSFAMTMSGDSSLSEEIAQETFYRVLVAEKSAFRGESDEFTWLCSIARNLFLDEMRKRKRFSEMAEEMDSGVNIEAALANRELSFRIHTILHKLEEPYREVFNLRVFGELSFREIGQIFEKTETWARVTFHRARLKIQERMDEDR